MTSKCIAVLKKKLQILQFSCRSMQMRPVNHFWQMACTATIALGIINSPCPLTQLRLTGDPSVDCAFVSDLAGTSAPSNYLLLSKVRQPVVQILTLHLNNSCAKNQRGPFWGTLINANWKNLPVHRHQLQGKVKRCVLKYLCPTFQE